MWGSGPQRPCKALTAQCLRIVRPLVQVPDSSFTGTATIEESGPRCLEGKEAFLDIRLAEDGGAYVFATT